MMKHVWKWLQTALLAAIVAGLCACSVHTVTEDVKPSIDLPHNFSTASKEGPLIERWWKDFGDPQLDTLIDRLLAENLDLQRSWARLDQAIALAGQAGSARFPQVGIDLGATRSKTLVSNILPGGEGIAQRTTTYSASTGASYEIDLWGRVASLDRAAHLDMLATRMDLETIAMTLTAQVAEVWFSLQEQQMQLNLLRSQQETNRTYLELIGLRFGRGLASSLDIYQQRQQLAGLDAQIPLIESRIGVLNHQLNILLGKAPRSGLVPIPSTLPSLWKQPPIGIPSELLSRRPDIEAARMRVAAADYRVGAAIANRFPSLKLSANAGFSAASLADLLKDWIWSILGNISATLWDGHKKGLEVERTRSIVEEQLALYAKTVLTALQETEDALVQENKQRSYISRLTIQADLAESTLREARQRYVEGLSDYLPVLTALQSLQQIERTLITAQRQLISYRIQLCRALGGTWTASLDRVSGNKISSGE